MTAIELIGYLLETMHKNNLPLDTKIVLSKDPEHNEHSTLEGTGVGLWCQESALYGTLYLNEKIAAENVDKGEHLPRVIYLAPSS